MGVSMDRWKGKIAVVTGASAGIGQAIVEKLVEEGVIVAGLARRRDRIEELSRKLASKSGKLHSVQADISKEDSVIKAFQWVKDNLGPISILVNNAGVLKPTSLTDGDAEFWRQVFDTNVIGLCIATREAVRIMREHSIDGHIVHINSIVGHKISSAVGNVYPASKYAVTALTETLRQELNDAKTRIKVSSISPGYVETDIFNANDITIDEHRKKVLEVAPRLYPEDVAAGVVYVLSTPPHVQVHELMIKPVGEAI